MVKKLTVVIHQEEDGMVSVQCLEHDIAAQGMGLSAAFSAFPRTLEGELALSKKYHDGTLNHIPAFPTAPPDSAEDAARKSMIEDAKTIILVIAELL